jgi:hypothetical protein
MQLTDYILALLQAIPVWIAAGVDIVTRLSAEEMKIRNWRDTGTDPTKADFDALNAAQAPKEAALQSDDDGA